MPRYRLLVHRKVLRFLNALDDERRKRAILENMENLERHPMSLREMDVASIRGVDKTFRIRVEIPEIRYSPPKKRSTSFTE